MASQNFQIEKKPSQNCAIWKIAIITCLRHEDLWECVDTMKTVTDTKEDVKANLKSF